MNIFAGRGVVQLPHGGFSVALDIPTINPLNVREHFRVRAARVASERGRLHMEFIYRGLKPPPLPVIVRLVRLSSGTLDDDAVPAAMKGIRDQLAVWLGLPVTKRGIADDRDPRVSWTYGQEQIRRGERAAIRVEFSPRGAT